MNHPRPPADWDLLAEGERSAWLDHVDACSDCRDRWVTEDPSRLFLMLADCPAGGDAMESATLDRLSANIRREIRPVPRSGRLVRLAAAAVLAGALLVPSSAWLFRDRTVPEAALLQTASFPLADVDVLSTPGEAQIIDLSVGNTQVVMIFDSRLEL